MLLAEDDAVSRLLFKEVFSTDPRFDVQMVNDGTAAWETMRTGPQFDVFVFDLMMPGCSGLDLVLRARSDRRLSNIPVVLCSASNDRETISRAVTGGVRHYVLKPISRSDVLKKVLAAVNSKIPIRSLDLAAAACGRLGVSDQRLGELIQHFSQAVVLWLSECRTAMREPELCSVMARANGLKGAAASLGAASMANELTECEAAFAVITQRSATKSDFLSRSDLDEVERCANRISSELSRINDFISGRV